MRLWWWWLKWRNWCWCDVFVRRHQKIELGVWHITISLIMHCHSQRYIIDINWFLYGTYIIIKLMYLWRPCPERDDCHRTSTWSRPTPRPLHQSIPIAARIAQQTHNLAAIENRRRIGRCWASASLGSRPEGLWAPWWLPDGDKYQDSSGRCFAEQDKRSDLYVVMMTMTMLTMMKWSSNTTWYRTRLHHQHSQSHLRYRVTLISPTTTN